MKEQTLTYEQLIALFKETDARMDKRFKETNARMDKGYQETKALFQETDAKFQETDTKFQETKALFQETDAKFQETAKDLDRLGKQIGGLGNTFGKYTEGLLGPSIRKILENNLGAEYVTANLKRKLNNKEFEIDFFGSCNGKVNKAFVVEVKTTLQDIHIDQLMKTIEMLPQIMPEQKGKKVLGAIAAISYTEEQKQRILEMGFYFMNITNELAQLDVPKNFIPKEY